MKRLFILVILLCVLLISSCNNPQVFEPTPQGISYKITYLSSWGSTGLGTSQFSTGYGIAVDSMGNVYVADTGNSRIQKFDGDGNFILEWGQVGVGNGDFDTPCGIAVDKDNNIYVSDIVNDDIQKFDSSGSFLMEITHSTDLVSPLGLDLDDHGNIYAVTGNDEIVKFNSSGDWVKTWGKSGTGYGEIQSGYGLAVNSENLIYVSDAQNNKILIFDNNGKFLHEFGEEGTDPGEIYSPRQLCFDKKGYLFIAENVEHRFQGFSPGGSYMGGWNDPADNKGCIAIVITKDNFAYVLDNVNNQVHKFKISLE